MTLQGHPRSIIYMSFEGQLYDFLLVIYSNLGPSLTPFSHNYKSATDRQSDGQTTTAIPTTRPLLNLSRSANKKCIIF